MRRSFSIGLVLATVSIAVWIVPTLALADAEFRDDGSEAVTTLECSVVWVPSCATGLVEDLRQQVVALKFADVTEVGGRIWLGGSLLSQLDETTRALEREDATGAVGNLRGFQRQVHALRGVDRGIFVYEADALVAQAEVIIKSFGAGGVPAAPPPSEDLMYLGGTVTEHPKVYLTYWGWGSDYSAENDPLGMVPVLEGFLTEIGGTPYLEPLTQYYGRDWQNSSLGKVEGPEYYISNDSNLLKGIWYDDQNPMSFNPSGQEIEQEVRRSAQHFGYDKDAIYYIVTPPNRIWGEGRPCSYHSSAANVAGDSIIYVDFPYQPQVCQIGLSGADATTIIAFHELIEAMTDPRYGDLPVTFGDSFGWVARDNRENADKCGTLEGFPKLDVNLGGSTYAIQAQWSNVDHACVYSWN